MSQVLSDNSMISHYRIVSKLGAGGMGEVYLAQDTKLNRKVALIEELKEKFARRQATGQSIAIVYVGLGDKEQAFAWLEKDFQSHSALLAYWLNFPTCPSGFDWRVGPGLRSRQLNQQGET